MAIGNLLTLDTFQNLQGVNYIFKIPQDVRRSQLRFRSNDSSPIPFSSLQGRSIFSARQEVNQILT